MTSAAATFSPMSAAAHRLTVDGDRIFGLRLQHLHPDRQIDADELARDTVAFISALEGQRDARFVLQTLCEPSGAADGRLTIDIFIALAAGAEDPQGRSAELIDDLRDLLAAPPLRWTFTPIVEQDELDHALDPIDARHFGEVARREEQCTPTRWRSNTGVGFEAHLGSRSVERDLWSLWTFGPASSDLRRLVSVFLAQEAPVCIRVSLEPTVLDENERAAIEELVVELSRDASADALLRASLHTLESILYLRPLFETRCVVASPDPLSRALLSAVGHSISEPTEHGAIGPVLQGGFAALRGGIDVDANILERAYRDLCIGDPTPSLAPAGLERVRRLLGPWEAANLFRIPVADDERFPGLDTLRVPSLHPVVGELPQVGARIGVPFVDTRQSVRLDPDERFRHLYVAGQTGTGKSTLLLNLALQDVMSGAGVAVFDPHGDLIEEILGRIPPERIDDVVLIDPADPVAVVGVNLLEAESVVQQEYVVSELCAMFYALFDPDRQGIVGPRFETWLRQAALLLLANPQEPASFLDISTVFVDPAVRNHLVQQIDDPILSEFWLGEMLQTADFHRSEVLGWFRSKFEVFRTSRLVRNVVGQAQSTISFTDILQNRRILLVNLAKGLLGEYNSSLIGHIVFARLWAAALERATLQPADRSDFFIHIDEFQNVTSSSLPSVLSEARKFRLGLTLANQFFTQVPENARDAIMGNVSSRVAFRLGPKDAAPFASWLGSGVESSDLTRLANHVAIASITTRGVPLDPFVLRTDPPAASSHRDRADEVRDRSRSRWAVPVNQLDQAFFNRWAHIPGSISAKSVERAKSPRAVATTLTASTFFDEWLRSRIADQRVDIVLGDVPGDEVGRVIHALRQAVPSLTLVQAQTDVACGAGARIGGVSRLAAYQFLASLERLKATARLDVYEPPDEATP